MTIERDFKQVSSEDDFFRFISAYKFNEMPATERWNLGIYRAEYDGRTYEVGYRWYDPSHAFSIRKDIHKAELSRIHDDGRAAALAEVAFEEG